MEQLSPTCWLYRGTVELGAETLEELDLSSASGDGAAPSLATRAAPGRGSSPGVGIGSEPVARGEKIPT